MQTFLPYSNYLYCSLVLDNRRLGKQRVEAVQIDNALYDPMNSWRNHTAVRMWRGYRNALHAYANVMIAEWLCRGNENNIPFYDIEYPIEYPPWLTDGRLLYSHRANLVRKLPEHYGRFWPNVDTAAPYWWPCGMRDKRRDRFMRQYYSQMEA